MGTTGNDTSGVPPSQQEEEESGAGSVGASVLWPVLAVGGLVAAGLVAGGAVWVVYRGQYQRNYYDEMELYESAYEKRRGRSASPSARSEQRPLLGATAPHRRPGHTLVSEGPVFGRPNPTRGRSKHE